MEARVSRVSRVDCRLIRSIRLLCPCFAIRQSKKKIGAFARSVYSSEVSRSFKEFSEEEEARENKNKALKAFLFRS